MAKSQYDRWVDTFKPTPNPRCASGTCDGCMFETFGSDLEHVKDVLAKDPSRVWTLIEGDNGEWYISQGFHLVNRVGYLVTEKPFDPVDPKQARYLSKDVLYFWPNSDGTPLGPVFIWADIR